MEGRARTQEGSFGKTCNEKAVLCFLTCIWGLYVDYTSSAGGSHVQWSRHIF